MSGLTSQTIRKIAGDMEEGRILEILKTGASEAELIEAMEWQSADDAMSRERHHPPSRRVSALCDILSRSEVATENEC